MKTTMIFLGLCFGVINVRTMGKSIDDDICDIFTSTISTNLEKIPSFIYEIAQVIEGVDNNVAAQVRYRMNEIQDRIAVINGSSLAVRNIEQPQDQKRQPKRQCLEDVVAVRKMHELFLDIQSTLNECTRPFSNINRFKPKIDTNARELNYCIKLLEREVTRFVQLYYEEKLTGCFESDITTQQELVRTYQAVAQYYKDQIKINSDLENEIAKFVIIERDTEDWDDFVVIEDDTTHDAIEVDGNSEKRMIGQGDVHIANPDSYKSALMKEMEEAWQKKGLIGKY